MPQHDKGKKIKSRWLGFVEWYDGVAMQCRKVTRRLVKPVESAIASRVNLISREVNSYLDRIVALPHIWFPIGMLLILTSFIIELALTADTLSPTAQVDIVYFDGTVSKESSVEDEINNLNSVDVFENGNKRWPRIIGQPHK